MSCQGTNFPHLEFEFRFKQYICINNEVGLLVGELSETSPNNKPQNLSFVILDDVNKELQRCQESFVKKVN